MIRLGTNYGGWVIPNNNSLNRESIVYSCGVGEDISFDIKLQSYYGCNLILIDPTQKAITHFDECKKFFKDKKFKFTGNIQSDYYENIKNDNPIMNNFKYLNIGVWSKKDELKFYKQSNPEYVSQSLINTMFTDNYDIVKVDSLKNIMENNNHVHIDLLKLDIEGAENEVLKQMLIDKIFPTYLCVEFDLLRNKKDYNNETDKIINMLIKVGYKIIINEQLNITFEYTK